MIYIDIQIKLFETALNVEKPIYIARIEFDREAGELHVYMDFVRGSRFNCPICEEKACPVYDTTKKT